MPETKAADRLPLLITNNPLCVEVLAGRSSCRFSESWDYGQVLLQARDCLHQGYHLLSHPQCGSMKPNQTPYKSLVLSRRGADGQDAFVGLALIEQALTVYEKFQKNHPTPVWPQQVLTDFAVIDLSLMQSVFERPQFTALHS